MEVRQIRKLFCDRCDIYRAEEYIEGRERRIRFIKAFENLKCRISYKRFGFNNESETTAKKNLDIRLYMDNEPHIKSGDIFVIRHMGREEKYKAAAEGIHYMTHQETEMVLFNDNP